MYINMIHVEHCRVPVFGPQLSFEFPHHWRPTGPAQFQSLVGEERGKACSAMATSNRCGLHIRESIALAICSIARIPIDI